MSSTAPMSEMNNLTYSNGSTCDVYSHHSTTKVMFALHYILVFIFGSCGNILALYITFQRRKKINSTDLYLINLAISDTFFTLALPGRVAYYILEFSWPFGDWLCRATAFIFYTNTYVGIYFMTCVSVDRYLAVVHAHRQSKFRKVGSAKYICLVVWCLVFIQTTPLLFRAMTKIVGTRTTCMEYFNFEEIPKLPLFLLLACVVGYFLPVGIILWCYLRINFKLCKITKENPLADKNGRHRKAFSVILVVLIALVLCFSPYHLNITQFMVRRLLYKPRCSEQQVFKMWLQITVALMNTNCCTDPVIYFFAFKGYKKRVINIFKTYISVPSSSTGKNASESNSSSHNHGAYSVSD
ncbi:G-protein coupled receptor 183-like [Rhinatrema bivittatum]|uniref:G-protein coupled receptor 183-like n=1 Tax=Rhinatrema bivittatum TaxID=194408 RepID=UPI00112916EB|nr:G-protein coupled receptor 183-like [Rhinatrema bivittatum]